MKKDTYWPIIQSIVMAIIATIMYIIFARTKATGNNNLFWIVIFAVFDAIVIIATIIDAINAPTVKQTIIGAINAPAVKQLALSLPYTILFAAQHFLIETEKISEICCHHWWNFSVGFAICVFNIVVYIVDEDLDDDECSAGVMAVVSGIILVCMVLYLLWLFYKFMSSI